MKKKYVLKKVAYSSLAAGVVLSTVVPYKVLAEQETEEALTYREAEDSSTPVANDEYKVPFVKGYVLEGDLVKLEGKNSLYASKSDLHLKLDFDGLDNVTELKILEDDVVIYSTDDKASMADIVLSKYVSDVTLDKSGVSDLPVEYKAIWKDSKGNNHSALLVGELKDKRVVYDAQVSSVKFTVDGTGGVAKVYSSLDKVPYIKVGTDGKLTVETTNTVDDIEGVDLTINGGGVKKLKKGTDNRFKLEVPLKDLEVPKNKVLHLTTVTTSKSGDKKTTSRDVKVTTVDPTFDFELKSTDGVVSGKKAIVGKVSSGYSIHFGFTEKDIPVELDKVELWKDGSKVTSASVVGGGTQWESDDLRVGSGTYEVKLVSDTGWSTKVGDITVVEDDKAPEVTDNLVVDAVTDGKDWVVGTPDVPFEVRDENGLHSVVIKANGTEVYKHDIVDHSTSFVDRLAGSKYKPDSNGKVKLEFIVTDRFGNVSTKVREFYSTNIRPSILSVTSATTGVNQVVFGQDLFADKDLSLKVDAKDTKTIMFINSKTNVTASFDALSSLVSLNTFDRVRVLSQLGISSDEFSLLKLYKDLNGDFIVDDKRPTGMFKGLDLPKGVDWYTSKPTGVSFVAMDDKALKSVRISANNKLLVDETVAKTGTPYLQSKEYPLDLSKVQVTADGKIVIEVEVEDMLGKSTFRQELKIDTAGFNLSDFKLGVDKDYKLSGTGAYFKEVPSGYTISGLHNLTGIAKYRVAKDKDGLKDASWKAKVDKIPYDDNVQWVQFEDATGRLSEPINVAGALDLGGSANKKATKVYLDNKGVDIAYDNKSKVVDVGGVSWVNGNPNVQVKLVDNLHLQGYEVYFNGEKVLDKVGVYENQDLSKGDFDLSSLLKKYVEDKGQNKVVVKVKAYDKAGNESEKEVVYNIDLGTLSSKFDAIGDGINDSKNKKYYTDKPYKIRLKDVKSASGIAKIKFYNDKGDVIKEEPYSEGAEIDVPVGSVGYFLESNLGATSEKVTLFDGSRLVKDETAPKLVEVVKDNKFTEGGKDWYASTPTVTVEGIDEENLSEFKVITPKGELISKGYELEKTTGTLSLDFTGLEGVRGQKITYNGTEYGSDDKNAYNFVYVVRDKVGHETVKASTFYVDSEKPALTGVLKTKPLVYGDNLFFRDEVRAGITAGSLSGIKSVTLGGKPLDLTQDLVRDSELLDEDVVVTNNLGVSTTKKLYEVLGISGKTVYIDKEAPKIGYDIKGEGNYKDERGRIWYSALQNFKVNLTDDKALGYYVVKVNGRIVANKVLDGVRTSSTEVIDFGSAETVTDGVYNIETILVDKAGRETKATQVVYVDKVLPDIRGLVLGEDIKVTPYKGYGYYVKGSKIDIQGYKLQTPITGAKLYRDGVVIDSGKGDYTGTGNAKYQYKDNLGRSSKEYTLSELLGLPTLDKGTFIYDTQEPTGKLSNLTSMNGKDVSTYNNGGVTWVNKLSYLGIDVNDDKGLHKLEVKVDDKVVYSKVLDGSLSHVGSIDLEKELGKTLEDGRHTVVYTVEDMAGYVHEESKVWYLDTKAPEVKNFEFIQEGYKEGSTLTTDFDKYGFFFQSGTQAKVYVEDGGISSGISQVEVVLKDATGGIVDTKKVNVENGYALVDIPVDFKGWIQAKVWDNLGNESGVRGADGVVTESKNWSVKTSNVEVNLPETGARTIGGLPLYRGNIDIQGLFNQSVSGVRGINWVVNGTNVGSDWTHGSMDKNLVTSGTSRVGVSGDNQEHQVVLGVTDNAGYLTENLVKFAIDTTAPVISVAYDNNNAQGSYFSHGRTATVTIVEKNFNPADVRLRGVGSALTWVSNGDTHTAVIPFTEDGAYNWGIEYTDLAGNVAQGYNSGDFVVDKTAPVVDVSWDNNDVKNGNYYRNGRTATITVRERNFDASKFAISGGTLSGWVSNGDIHTARVTFGDGEHRLTVSGSDMAGNATNNYDSGNFIVDNTSPELGVSGVTDGASYDGDVLPVITFSDKYINTGSVKVTLRGQRNGVIEMRGSVSDGKFYVENLPKELKYDDYYTLTAHVEDMAGNVVEKSISFYVNRFGAAFTFGSKDNVVKYFKEVTEDIELTVTSVTPLDIDKFEYTVQLDGQVKDIKRPKVVESRDSKGNYVYRIIYDKENFKENGVWGISVKTVDKFGKTSDSGSVKMNFIVDNVKPNIVFVGAEDNEFIESTRHKVTVKVTDNVKLKGAKVLVNGEEVNFTDEDVKRGFMDIYLDGSDKPYVLEALATDLAGNKVEATVSNFYVSTNSFLKFKASIWFKVLLGALGIVGAIVTYLVGRWVVLTTKRRRDEDRALEGK